VKYDLPFFAFVVPKNLLKNDPDNENVANAAESKEDAPQPAEDEKKREAHGSVASATQANAAGSEVSAVDASSVETASTTPAALSNLDDKEKITEKTAVTGVDAVKDKNARDPNQLKLKFRFSNGMTDCSAYFPVRSTIGEMKKFLEKEKKVAADKQLILFQGKRYADQLPLSNCPFKSGIMLQVLIRG